MRKDTWAYHLIRLLKDYPNIYADIVDYDLTGEHARKIFEKLFELEKKGKFKSKKDSDPEYELSKKLLWGSDVPMIISLDSYKKSDKKKPQRHYSYLLENFEHALSGDEPAGSISPSETVYGMIRTNPCEFLFGTKT